MNDPLDAAHLPAGIRARILPHVNGLDMHVLEAGEAGRPLLLLLHGFPELAFSWRHVMVPLAEAGYHVVAPDQRGYGRTTGWVAEFDGEIQSFGPLNYVRDALALVAALGHTEVAGVIGHDFGSPVAGNCALARPDVFRSVVLMSAPYGGPRPWPMGEQAKPEGAAGLASGGMNEALSRLDPPRKHYQWYYSTREANSNMWLAEAGPAGLHPRLLPPQERRLGRQQALRLVGWEASELAKMPTYYIMPLELGMAETVAAEMPGAAEVAANTWLPAEGPRGLCDGVWPHRLPGRASILSLHDIRAGGPRCGSSAASGSRCRPATSPAPATGACTRSRATSRRCRTRPARISAAATSCRARALGAAGAAGGDGRSLLLDFLRRKDTPGSRADRSD
jgi:pimeloyl-ACP methyl ester carboxylesterase